MWNREKIIIVIVAAAIILVAVIFSVVSFNGKQPTSTSSAIPGAPVLVATSSPTRLPVPADVVVPNEGDVSAPANVAVPDVQAAAHPESQSSYRQFAISMDNGAFSPNTVAVNEGDIVDLEITAVDQGYTFTQPDYGFNAAISRGSTQKIQFQAVSAGKFVFYCSSCGGPSSGPVGYLIVTDN